MIHNDVMRYLIMLTFIVLLASCDSSRIYEDYENMEGAFWHTDTVKTFSFTIQDTSRTYNMKAIFSNTSSYPFYNLYYHYALTDSLNSIIEEELKEVELFHPKTGKPHGSGLGDLFDHVVILKENHVFSRPGSYTIKLRQHMRVDTLSSVVSVGARVEYADKSN